ncbi:MAG: N-glycosylase/DNA lyase [Candidatus Helarchaeota archaeon]
MEELLNKIETLKLGPVGKQVELRINEFKKLRNSSWREIFKELCFCILTANFNAERAIEIQKNIDDGFINDNDLASTLKKFGHRFPNTRAKYIIEARKYMKEIKDIINSYNDPYELRDWLSKNIKGLGFKESSHFLRNIGFIELAIIDFHIIDLLSKFGLISKPKSRSLSKKKYLEIEEILKKLAEKLDLNLAELDLYLWYIETNKILK